MDARWQGRTQHGVAHVLHVRPRHDPLRDLAELTASGVRRLLVAGGY